VFIRQAKPEDCAAIRPSEITSSSDYLSRRQLLQGAIAVGLIGTAWTSGNAAGPKLKYTHNAKFSVTEKPTSFEDVTHYNNYYEFSTDKEGPADYDGKFKTQPWAVKISGEAEVTGNFTLESIVKPHALEERIYRMRCVEAWSMVIPWVGIPLGAVLKRFKPTSKAKYVAFKTVYRPDEMPGQNYDSLSWPYLEGLRIDEAMHPLALLAVGVYGESLPVQNGAPLRLVTPWKYGFKGIKSIVEISFTEKQPPTAWNIAAPQEYGFYANVNPRKDHPRWSQARERVIGGGAGIFAAKKDTLMFNGYEEQVASLYAGMDLNKFY
jgi:methionine sulfoxide reductase catalytic subunit